MKKYIRITCTILSFPALLLFNILNAQPYSVIVTTTAIPPVSSFLNLAYSSSGSGVRGTVLQQSIDSSLFSNPYNFKVAGRLERLPPSAFLIELKPATIPLLPRINLLLSVPYPLTATDFQNAFGNFDTKNLNFSGVAANDIIQPGNNFKLPDGIYRICFTVLGELRGVTGGPSGTYKPVSAPGQGCATFTICTKGGSAPQFTQPVSNLSISSSIPVIRPTSPVVFTWTTPTSICGTPPSGYRYDFEIWEILPNQTVTDAVRNPFVFRKLALPSPTFLLDSNLYRNVLQQGKKYAIRVKANNASLKDTFSIENNGYSRVEAFQYGTTADVVITPFPVREPKFYYIPFGERRTMHWDDVYTAYLNGTRRDTVVPLKEYIALNLIQNGIAYNPNAIELFLALNPELASLKEVQISSRPRLPEFPTVQQSDRTKFDQQHKTNLTPDVQEGMRFKKYLDSLKTAAMSLRDTMINTINNLNVELDRYNKTVQNVNRVSVNLINNLLAELVYNLQHTPGKRDDTHIRNVILNIRELMVNTPNSTSMLFPPPGNKQSLLSTKLNLSVAGYSMITETNSATGFLPVEGAVLPLDVIVWRGSAEPPARAISNSPDLTAAYRVFYTTPALYNHKNPRINATVLPGLAATSQVSLPKLSRFKFWTLNMVNHKTTGAEEIETNDIFLLNSKKKWPNSKRLYVVLKVD